MGQLIALVIALILGDAQLGVFAEPPICRAIRSGGYTYARSGRREPALKCHLFTNSTICLERYGGEGYSNENYSGKSRPSCAWHHMQTQRLLETIRIHSWGTNAVQEKYARGPGQLNFRGSLCRLSITAVLPENSINKYGAYLSLQGGPYMAGFGSGSAVDMSDHRRETMTEGCTILPGAGRRNCTVKLVPPVGYALDQRFIDNSLYVNFFVIDPERLNQLRTRRELTPNKRMYVDLVQQWKRCSPEELDRVAAAKLKPAPSSQNSNTKEELMGKNLVDDQIVFGPTEYSLTDLSGWDPYFQVDYRTYFITAVTGIDYEVAVGKKVVEYDPRTGAAQSPSSKEKTPLTVFFAEEPEDFYLGLDCKYDPMDKTKTTCIPPTKFKVNGTKVCEGFKCKGSLRGLDPKKEYFLWISYPRYLDPGNYSLVSSKKKITSPYATEMVTIKAWAHEWSLGKVNTETISDEFYRLN
ncbi:hypothetical protein NADE_000741 [Nannochloris sp. 'desiccata']|nr:hypothetical protein KSW81_003746 [Chlorella desiccata (nom. nud.)]KAH7615904.1 hypothetical protein NADE_000741 [Chlorella desiccata (nom. nud.)]